MQVDDACKMVGANEAMTNCGETKSLCLNIGCGFRKVAGFINVDKQAACGPDVLLDVEATIWPWLDNSVTRILFNHSLEHIGADPKVFVHVLREVYRVCVPDATVRVNSPHPRHDHFLMDPTHVRPITPQLFSLFDLDQNEEWIHAGAANTPLAIYANVNFRVTRVTVVLTDFYLQQQTAGLLSRKRLVRLLSERNNVAREYQIDLRVIK